jgi:hypothetical protein
LREFRSLRASNWTTASRWQIFPGDLDLTLDWMPKTDLSVALSTTR